tara:strand:- start:143 stop:346 length:204 start_codon:yes stop_codon:yes gene_type:complete
MSQQVMVFGSGATLRRGLRLSVGGAPGVVEGPARDPGCWYWSAERVADGVAVIRADRGRVLVVIPPQ